MQQEQEVEQEVVRGVEQQEVKLGEVQRAWVEQK